MIKDKYWNICIKAITGNISNDESEILKNWLAESGSNVNEFERIKKIWIDSAPEKSEIDPNAEWFRLNEKLSETQKQETNVLRKKYSFSDFFIPKLKPVVSTVGLLLIIIAAIYYFNKKEPQNEMNLVSTLQNENRNIFLPDGSSIYLNSGSKIDYPKEFNDKERKVKLEGEAFFSVAKENRPFIITTNNAKIRVMGTKFDVFSLNNKTRVVVNEGKVNLSGKYNKSGIDLTKNQLSIIQKDMQPTQPVLVDSKYFLGWMQGKLVFYQTPLNEIINQLQNIYGIKIKLKNESLQNYTLTGSFNRNSPDTTLSMICLALGLDLNKKQNEYFIKSRL